MSTTTKAPKRGCTITPLKKTSRTWKDFPARDDGSNESAIQAFAFVASFIMANCSDTFSVNDFMALIKGRAENVSASDVSILFSRWVKEAISQGKVEEVASVYSQPLYRVV